MTKIKTKILAADLFCGAGGTSQGLLMAANAMKADLELIAINHWQVAIDTHTLNHPSANHLCTGLDSITDPRSLVPGGRLNVLCASPECTHHSVARGGKPMSDQSRASAWHILRFAEALYIDNLIIENVPEFVTWGPLGANGRPLRSKRGHLFAQFIASLRALGYAVEWKVLNCADFGDPTTRRRLFIIARRGKKIRWPKPTHAQLAMTLFPDTRKPWRTAREIIDWKLPSKSIFERKKPLADKTLLRIQAGLKKFCNLDVDLKRCFAEDLRPFLVVLRGTGTVRSVDDPVQTLTASGNHVGLAEPFAVLLRKGQGARSVDDPLAALTTKGANYGVAEPFLTAAGGTEGQGRQPHSVDETIGTVLTNDRRALVEPFVLPDEGFYRGNQSRSVDLPLQTVTAARGAGHLIEPFVVPQGRRNDAREIDRPLDTITTTSRGVGVVEPFIVPNFGEREGQDPRTHSVDEPAPAVTSHGAGCVVEPFLTHFRGDHSGRTDGSARNSSTDAPLPTQDTSNRFGLAEPFMVTVNHGDGDTTRRAKSVDDPIGTVTGKIGDGVCEPFVIAYYGTHNMGDTGEPLATVTSRDRFGLVEAEATHYRLDIKFRMLQPAELARAQGFPDSYKFTGNREAVVKQIGNAVPPNTAAALAMELLA